MQETKPQGMQTDEALRRKLLEREYFVADDQQQLTNKMNDRLMDKIEGGQTLVRRVKVGRNQPCPCGSGRKFKKCCIRRVRT